MDKLYLIIITHAPNMSFATVKVNLALDSLNAKAEVNLYRAQLNDKEIFIGKYDDKIIIVSQSKIFDFYNEKVSLFEKKICSVFPNSEIAVLTLNSTVSMYGYCIIKDGTRKRVKLGADDTVYIDHGEKLKVERDVASEPVFDDEELKEMRHQYKAEQVQKMIENEIGVRVTSRLLMRYFGNNKEELYNNLEKIKLTEYQDN